MHSIFVLVLFVTPLYCIADNVHIETISGDHWFYDPSSFLLSLSPNPPPNTDLFTLRYDLWYTDGSVSFESSINPMFYVVLQNNDLQLQKIDDLENDHDEASFLIHYDEWRSGTVSFESRSSNGIFIAQSKNSLVVNTRDDLNESFGPYTSFIIHDLFESNSTLINDEINRRIMIANIIIGAFCFLMTFVSILVMVRQGVSPIMIFGMVGGMLLGMSIGMYVGMIVFYDIGMLVGMIIGMLVGMVLGMGIAKLSLVCAEKMKDGDYLSF